MDPAFIESNHEVKISKSKKPSNSEIFNPEIFRYDYTFENTPFGEETWYMRKTTANQKTPNN
jgi:hypothetical protein